MATATARRLITQFFLKLILPAPILWSEAVNTHFSISAKD